jgi:hypothetical protein
MRRLTTTLALAVAIALAQPAGANARIILNRGVGPVRIGMTLQEVRAKLGKPDIAERSGSTTSLVYRARKLVVTSLDGRVRIVSTRSHRERTSRGVGPGSTIALVRRRVRDVRCGAKAGVIACKLGSSRRGRRSTVFLISHGIVDTVSVALAP